ncbi:MAG TPA: hypothetical protein VK582_24450 [Pyrinomonadaceae bacterium]|nr:hypothetical protein [Pyrinomonadaceae bacterium]
MLWIDPTYNAKLIKALDDTRFAALCNSLLSGAAGQHGVRACLTLNLSVKEADGGIDGRCVDSPKKVGRLIPRAFADYQYRSGSKKKSAAKIVEEDIIAKPRVIDGLKNGHAFVFMAGWDRADNIDSELVTEFRKQRPDLAIDDDQILFNGRTAIAQVLQGFPGLVAIAIGVDLPLSTLEKWSTFPHLRNEFQVDASVQRQLDELKTRIEQPASRTRIVGAAGDGKTRLTMEALRGSELSNSVLYARQVDEVTASFIAHLERTNDIHCTVVVDETDETAAKRLVETFSSMPTGVRLVTIGLEPVGNRSSETLQVEGLNDDLLVATMKSIAPALPPENARAIARECEHSPKLAVVIAQRINEHPELLEPGRLLADGALKGVLDTYLPIDSGSPAWPALATTSLLMRLGWTDEVDSESEILFRAVEMNPAEARRAVEELHERYGIAPLAGRFRYVSPAYLADHLAARRLSSWTRNILTQFVTALTPEMKQQFVRRLRRASSILTNRGMVEEVMLGDQGPFQSLDDLESSDIAPLLRHMAAPFPQATLRALYRLIGDSSTDELRAAKKSRRDVVWAIEQLLWPEATFEAAARLLLTLAISENETWSNNASGLWVETFQTFLGRTAAPPVARARVIQFAASSTDVASRKLAAEALGAALKVEHVHRGGMPPSDVEGIPDEEWKPTTIGQLADALEAYLELLKPLLRDEDGIVRRSATNALYTAVAGVVQFAQTLFDIWLEETEIFVGSDYSEREVILRSIRNLTERLKNELNRPNLDFDTSPDRRVERLTFVQECLRKLAATEGKLLGDDFSSRFRWVLFQTNQYSGIQQDKQSEKDAAKELEMLTQRAIESPKLLEEEWEWLFDQREWGRVVGWIELLGRLDAQLMFENTLREKGEAYPVGAMFLSVYYLAHSRAFNDADFIDERLRSLIASGARPELIFDLVFRAGYTEERQDLLRRMFESGSIPAVFVSQLTYRPWGPEIPVQQALELVVAAMSKADSPDAVIPFVSGYLYQVKDAIPTLREAVLQLLLAPREKEIGQDPLFNWARLALMYVTDSPIEIASAALEQISVYGIHREDELIGVVERAWETADKETMFRDTIAEWLVREDVGAVGGAWSVRKALERVTIEQVGTDFLVGWVSEDPEARAAALADVIGAPAGGVTDLHRQLLERFGAHGVGSSFFSSYMTGSWTGSFASWLRGKLETARTWLSDKSPATREWAQTVVRNLEDELQLRENREQEERFLRYP